MTLGLRVMCESCVCWRWQCNGGWRDGFGDGHNFDFVRCLFNIHRGELGRRNVRLLLKQRKEVSIVP